MEEWDESWDEIEPINQDIYVDNRVEHLRKTFKIDNNITEESFIENQEIIDNDNEF